jgi:hypothetical protein
MKIVFFKTPKPKRFNYVPRYYDQEKEEMEKRRKELGLIGEGDERENLRAAMRRRWRVDSHQRADRTSAIRVIVYLFVLFVTVYLFFFTDVIGKMLSIFSGN